MKYLIFFFILVPLYSCNKTYRSEIQTKITNINGKYWKSFQYSERGALENNGLGFMATNNGKLTYYYNQIEGNQTIRVSADDSDEVHTWKLICDSIIVFDNEFYYKIKKYTDTEIVTYYLNRDILSGLSIWRKEADQSTSISPHIYHPSDTFRM